MKNTRKKNHKSNNKTKKNSIKHCMETFVENKIKYLSNYNIDKQIKKLDNKQINRYKKQYKLYNCNINCKNTLLEPGSPDEVPKSMRKEFHNSKELIKIFSKRRKEIFKNKRNVLIDNFYENIPELTKQNLVKEGAISDCALPSNLSGGSYIFDHGKKIKTNETFNGKPFFRKVFHYSDPPQENQLIAAQNENAIVNILINKPFPNIVNFYAINKDYVEMEELDISTEKDKTKLIETMSNVKDFLQSIGIMYIDWKPDNIGISKDGTYKLFDFDASGVVDLKTNKWIVKPLEYWSYRKAIEQGFKIPQQIDDFSFEYGIVGIKDQPF